MMRSTVVGFCVFALLVSVAKGSFRATVNTRRGLSKDGAGQARSQSRAIDDVTNDVENEAAKNAFTNIYKSQYWSSAGGGSGAGSTLEMTAAAMGIIRLVANTYGLRSLIDTPCGAFTWQPIMLQLLEDDFLDFKYMGIDVVEHVIQGNQARHAAKNSWKFLAKDLSTANLPSGYDLLLSRDALQHLPCKTAVSMLKNIAASRPKYLLLGSYDAEENVDISMGEYYSINLRQPPFNLKNGVLHVFDEHTSMLDANEPDKKLLLLNATYMEKLDFAAMTKGCSRLAYQNPARR